MKRTLLKFLLYGVVFFGILILDVYRKESLLNTPVLIGLAVICALLLIVYSILKNDTWKTILINSASVFIIFLVFEKILLIHEKIKEESNKQTSVFSNGHGPFRREAITGYVHHPNYTGKAFGKVGDTILYDVTYRTDKNGCRVTPEVNPDSVSQSIIFLGCSFTFGFGLEDQQTFPWFVGDSLKQKFRTYNFGVNGYGPHQILASLENGMLDTIVKEKPKYCIYTGIASHAERIVNLYPWGYKVTDPEYSLNADGHPEYQGPFGDESSSYWKIQSVIRESMLFKKVLKKKLLSTNDLELFISIIDAIRIKIQTKYPDCEFHVVFWDDQYEQKERCDRMIAMLKEKKINLHLIHNILPEWETKSEKYLIYQPYEGHPNGYANQIIARYIRKEIIDHHNQLSYE